MSEEMKRYVLKLRSKEIVGEDYYIFNFDMPEGISYIEGQYGVFMHIDKEIEGRKVRAFSIASSLKEKVFKIATKIIEEPSDFKIKMRELKVGETMTFDGPMGKFTLDEGYNSVFIAGGIGITPVRGILKQIEGSDYNKSVELIYSEPRQIYPFKEEIDKLNFVTKHYEFNTEDTKKVIEEIAIKYLNTAYYYVVGSPGFIGGVKEQILGLGVKSEKIKFDRFNGY